MRKLKALEAKIRPGNRFFEQLASFYAGHSRERGWKAGYNRD
ncbi:MAG TPA: hypothetical protein VH186_22435 [Chloroflexia bacterium]|nr:hypothetical protein [Chloroflexia bacterium]